MGCGQSSEPELTNSFDVNEKTLSTFLQLEKDISEAEAQNPMKVLDLKADQLLQLSEKRRELEKKLSTLEREANSSAELHNDEIETHKFFVQNGVEDPDQEKHLDLLNEKEIVSKELHTTKDQYKGISKEVRELERKADDLQSLYKKEDKLLAQIFGGEYGSIRENQLEHELDYLEVQRAKILEANFKWRQGQMMLEYACKQLGVAVKTWREISTISSDNLEKRYSVAAIARNNIVAAIQNISGAQRYLSTVEFPYCNEKEVATLNKAVQYIFTDMQTEDRHDHANQCYTVAHKRCNALRQWFDTVINSTIMKDLHENNEKVKTKSFELRRERVRLIREKVKQIYGTDLQLDQTLRGRDISTGEIAGALLSEREIVKVEGTSVGVNTPPLLSLGELAPIPSNSAIFGKTYDSYKDKIEELTRQHQEDIQNFLKEKENTQNKIKGDLEEKLMVRRQRRARMRMEESQKEFLKY